MKILIVGAGAAGMMAAATIIEGDSDAEVCVVEKNAILGRKVLLSGGGRCNLTTAETDIPLLMKAYPRGGRWLRFAMHEFSPADVHAWFEKHRIPLKTEGKKIFPRSNDGEDVTEMFLHFLEDNNVEIILETAVETIEKDGDGFKVSLEYGDDLYCDKLILTTGGSAYSHTGSSGDGYAFARALGHSISPLAATLTSFAAVESWVSELAGVSIENAKLKLVGEEKYEVSGPFLFTHKGVSGPGIFALSSLSAFEKFSKDSRLKLFVDFVPGMNSGSLSEEILQKAKGHPKKTLLRIMNYYLPKSLLAVIFDQLGLDGTKTIAEISKKNINRCVESLKNFEMTLKGRIPGAEIVTAGGVKLDEVDSKTMESKICPGLYFGGELLDVDGFTGGYNLQIAWATGRLAGVSALGGDV